MNERGNDRRGIPASVQNALRVEIERDEAGKYGKLTHDTYQYKKQRRKRVQKKERVQEKNGEDSKERKKNER